MQERRCRSCTYAYLQDLPVGFAVDDPMAIGMEDGALHNPKNGEAWIHGPLMDGYASKQDKEVNIERVVYHERDRVIILNTLDFLYGHVLLKLYNAQHYLDQYPDHGLIVILPRMFKWLVPAGVAEVWIVDQRLGEAHGWYTAIDRFVNEQLPRYKEVGLGKGYAHPEFASMDISRFTKVEPFKLEEFNTAPRHITFVARQDRLWFATAGAKLLYRILNRLGLRKSLGRSFVRWQDILIKRSMERILRVYPDVSFTVVGLGDPGGFGPRVQDLRTLKMNEATELAWCNAYAKSQIVVGVHGSNMLLPTAHAAGCIEILPYDRYGNIVQDVSVRYHDRMQLFLYRFVDEFASPRTIARHAVSMFKDFTVYHRDNRENIF
ncbi:MAG: hypothetical protein KF905_01060 [Flavobacteriales bacterium]|nr:hypothetical protein [Flavobacteriales bacterium]